MTNPAAVSPLDVFSHCYPFNGSQYTPADQCDAVDAVRSLLMAARNAANKCKACPEIDALQDAIAAFGEVR